VLHEDHIVVLPEGFSSVTQNNLIPWYTLSKVQKEEIQPPGRILKIYMRPRQFLSTEITVTFSQFPKSKLGQYHYDGTFVRAKIHRQF